MNPRKFFCSPDRGVAMVEYIIVALVLVGALLGVMTLLQTAISHRAESSVSTIADEMAPCCKNPPCPEVQLQGSECW